MPDSTLVRGTRKSAASKPPAAHFLAGGGEMGRRMRALDWSRTSVGAPDQWPVSLRTAVRLLLTATRQPMLLWWGERRVVFYNDACKGIVGARHPALLGQPGATAWASLWERIGKRVEAVSRRNEAQYDESVAVELERESGNVEARIAISYSPIPADDGSPGGVLGVVNEFESMTEAATGLSSELDLDALLQKLTDAGTRLTKARFGAFFHNVTNDDGESYQLYTLSGAARESFDRFGLPRATPLFGPTFRGERVVRLDDVTKAPEYGTQPPHHGMPKGHLPVKSYLSVPVVSRTGEVFGGLFFGHPEAGMFDERAERNARVLAAHAAVAIDNAKLFALARDEIERRSQVEAALRDSERRYRELVQGLPAAVYTTDADGRIELFNAAAVELWGREPSADAYWCGADKLFDTEGRPVALERSPIAHVLRGEAWNGPLEMLIERPDGSRRHALSNPRALTDSRGTVTGAINMVVDITEHKRAQSELAATRDELAIQVKSLTSLHDMAMRLGGMTDLMPALQSILDVAVEVHGAQFGSVNLFSPESRDLVLQATVGFDDEAKLAFSHVKPGAGGGSCGAAFDTQGRVIVVDTETDPCFENVRELARRIGFRAVHSTLIVTRGGEQLGVLSVHFRNSRHPTQREIQLADVCARHAADVVEHYRAQEQLRKSERLYRAIGESINYGVWVCDEKGRSLYVSDSFLRLTGLPQQEYAQAIWSKVVVPEDAGWVKAQWKRCVAEGLDWEAEVRIRTVDGGTRAILSRGVAIRDEHHRITGWAGMNLDIDRLKRVENELRSLDQRKNEFLATLAHELRNPLAPIRNGLEIMRLGRGNAGMVEQARTMLERQLHQMIRLVDDLLDVSRVSRGKIELRRERIELATALRDAIETAKPLIEQNAQELVVDIPSQAIPLDADLTRLAQVFGNILNNAAKYTDRGGRIDLSARVEDGHAVVSVRDNGIGIPPPLLESVFGIFTQVDRSLEKARGGLGIGLSIARRLVEMHGGTVVAKSDGLGHGSEFVVRLPIAPDDGMPVDGDRAAARSPSPHRCRVLIADDNLDAAMSLSLMLQVMGNDVRVANDGLEALAVAEAFAPDAILLDIGMPGLNGYEVCRRMRERPWGPRPAIIALTGWGQEEDRQRSAEAGFDHHLVKPVEPSKLEALLSSLARR